MLPADLQPPRIRNNVPLLFAFTANAPPPTRANHPSRPKADSRDTAPATPRSPAGHQLSKSAISGAELMYGWNLLVGFLSILFSLNLPWQPYMSCHKGCTP